MSSKKETRSNFYSRDLSNLIKKYRHYAKVDELFVKIEQEISNRYYNKSEINKSIAKANNKLLELAQHKYKKELEFTDIEEMNTLFTSINILGQELNYSTVTTHYLNDLFSSIADIIMVCDEIGNIMYMNESGCQQLCLDRKEFRGFSISDFLESNTEFKKLLRASRSEKPIVLISRNLKQIPVLMKISDFGRVDNPMIGHVVVARDISLVLKQQKEIEEKSASIALANKDLKLSEHKFRKSIEFSPVPMIIALRNYEVLFCNRKFVSTYGYHCGEIPNIKIFKEKAFPENKYRQFVKRQWKEDLAIAERDQTSTQAREYIVKCKDGNDKIAEISIFSESDILIVILNDITERKEAEYALLDMNQKLEYKISERTRELEEKNKQLKQEIFLRERIIQKEKELNQQKTQFISMVSHEFRTPIAGIHTGIQLIEKFGSKWDKTKTLAIYNDIENSFEHLNSILEKISDLNRIEMNEGIKCEYLEMRGFCKNAIDTVTRIYSTGIQIRLSCIPKEISVYSDSSLLRHIIYNVLSNAVKFSDRGVSVHLKLRLSKGNIVIHVEDRGIGIPENELDDIFTMFQRGTNAESVRGTGIGLTIVKKCVDLLNGTIKIKSKLDEGTKVIITLPQIQGNPEK